MQKFLIAILVLFFSGNAFATICGDVSVQILNLTGEYFSVKEIHNDVGSYNRVTQGDAIFPGSALEYTAKTKGYFYPELNQEIMIGNATTTLSLAYQYETLSSGRGKMCSIRKVITKPSKDFVIIANGSVRFLQATIFPLK